MAMNYTPLPFDFLEEAADLTDEEYGRLIRWAQHYQQTGEVGELPGNERFLARRLKMQLDRYCENYEQKAGARRDAGRKGAAARWGDRMGSQAEEPERMAEMANAYDRIDDDAENADTCDRIADDGKNANTETNTKTNTETNGDIIEPLNHSTDIDLHGACAARFDRAPPAAGEAAPKSGGIPLNDGSEFLPTRSEVAEWAALYPAVDVMQQLRAIRGYFLANPKNRKTRGGIRRSINSWLSKEQNRAPRVPAGGGGSTPSAADSDAAEMMKYFGQLPARSE